ncbi:MAG: BlaI/MecI/CopY family transcriptional regulator [Chitinophagaceae bacterium]|nr:BlaI/MecI/CopY family transcriptional regulator [Chitinophagaceae bacterium]
MRENLTQQEEQALLAVYAVGEGNVKMFLDKLEEVVPYTTLASTIKNLEKKGYLVSRAVGNAYLYKPAFSEEEYKKQYMNGVVKSYFDNSYKQLVNFFVEQKKLSPKELKEIIEMIEREKS